jgi:hypothetical protein
MVCPEKASLLAEYEAAALRFAQAVSELRRNIGISVQPQYEQLQDAADAAQAAAEEARLSLEQHTGMHEC